MTSVLDSGPSVDSLAALLTAEAQFQGNGPLKAALTTAWKLEESTICKMRIFTITLSPEQLNMLFSNESIFCMF